MNIEQLKQRVRSSMHCHVHAKGFVSSIDVLLDLGYLTKQSHEDWRFKRVPYLEKVCHAHPGKLSTIIREMRAHAQQNQWKPSWTFYGKWGKGPKMALQFSRSGDPNIERAYATHFVGPKLSKPSSEQTKQQEPVTTTPGVPLPEDPVSN